MTIRTKSPSEIADELEALCDGRLPLNQRAAAEPEPKDLFGGLVGVDLAGETFELGDGIRLSPTYAHCFSHFMAAFSKPKNPNAPHGGPWSAMQGGGVGFDVEAEVWLSEGGSLSDLSRYETLEIAASLIRLLSSAAVRMPAVANMSFTSAASSIDKLKVWSFETMRSGLSGRVTIDSQFASGLTKCLPLVAARMSDPRFRTAYRTLDAATWMPTPEAYLIAVWTSIEAAVQPPRKQRTKNLGRSLGDFLGHDRRERDRIYNRVVALYETRGSVAHAGQPPAHDHLRESYLLARRMLIRIIADKEWPKSPSAE